MRAGLFRWAGGKGLATLGNHASFTLDVLRGGERNVVLRDGIGCGPAILEEFDDLRTLAVRDDDAGLAGAAGLAGLPGLATGLHTVRLVEGDDEFLGGGKTEFTGDGLKAGGALGVELVGEFGGTLLCFREGGESSGDRGRGIHIGSFANVY